MQVLFVTDIHGNKEIYEKVLAKTVLEQQDAIIFGGDLCPHQLGQDLERGIAFQRDFLQNWLVPKLEAFHAKNKEIQIYWMMGNDDYRINEKLLQNNKAFSYIHQSKEKLGNLFLVGYSFIPPTPFRLTDWEKVEFQGEQFPEKMEVNSVPREPGSIEEDLAKLKKLSNPKKTIYSIHTPPFKTKLDMVHSGEHVGSKAVRKFIEVEQPLLCLHGHIHESPVVSGTHLHKIGETLCVNPGSFKGLTGNNNNAHIILFDTENPSIIQMEKI